MNHEGKLPAVVLAGGLADLETQVKYSIEYRAEMPIAGKKMVQYVIDALDKASHVGDICVVGNTKCEGVNRIIPAGSSMIDNLIAGINAYGNTGAVLVATADIPLLTPEAVDDFIERCVEHEADFYYPIISRELSEKRIPGMRRTYARIAEGTYTGGNIVVIQGRFILEHADLIRQVMEARKNKMRLAQLIGIGILVRAVIAQCAWARAISLGHLERTVGRIMHAKVKAVETPYPEIGADVDNADQAYLVEKELQQQLS